jgi:hypothetical protein
LSQDEFAFEHKEESGCQKVADASVFRPLHDLRAELEEAQKTVLSELILVFGQYDIKP